MSQDMSPSDVFSLIELRPVHHFQSVSVRSMSVFSCTGDAGMVSRLT